jgi:hypothetical protein
MNKGSIVLLVTVALTLGASRASAHAVPAIGQTGAAMSSSATPSSSDGTTLSVRGAIDKYDQSTRTLVLSTASGQLQFPIAPTTRIRRGWHAVDPADLPKLTGAQATVRYTESGGSKNVESVHVFGK